MKNSEKLPTVQYLRAIAAIAVVIDHAAGMSAFPKYFGKEVFGGFLYTGAIGVDLFFIISGFIITLVSLDKNLLPKISIRYFLEKRFSRIVPMMWIAILSYAALRFITNRNFYIEEYLTALFLIPIGEVEPNHIWTLRHEFIFYSAFGLFVLLLREKFKYFIYAWFALPLILFALFGENTPESMKVFASPVNIEFMAGHIIGIAYLKGRIGIFEEKKISAAFLLIALFIILMWITHEFSLRESSVQNKTILAIACSAIVLTALSFNITSNNISKIGLLLGEASFSIYLFHPHIESALLFVLSKAAPTLNIYAVISLVSLASVAFGVVTYLLVERKVVKYSSTAIGKIKFALA